MKVVFIQPSSSYLLEDRVMPPLGLLYLASWLQKFGHEVQIIDLAGVPDWKKTLKDDAHKMSGAGWIGITCTTPQYFDALKIRSEIRAMGFNTPVVVGGIHLTSLAHANEMEFLNDGFDSYCIGEGFNAVTKMCDDNLSSGLKKMYTEPILKDVNDLPFAARDLIDIKSYKYKLGDVPAATFYSQWGCVYACLSTNTYITQRNNQQTRIDRLRIGDYIINTEGTKSVITARSQTEPKQLYELELETGEKIVGSEDHPVLTNRGWVSLGKLRMTDAVLSLSANSVGKSSTHKTGNRNAALENATLRAGRNAFIETV